MAPSERFAVEPPLVRPGEPLSPGMSETQGDSEAWFLDWRVPQKHFVFRDLRQFSGQFRGVPLVDGMLFIRKARDVAIKTRVLSSEANLS